MKKSKDFISKRQQFILNELKEKHTIKTDDLANSLNVSPITIRRDLQFFEEEGLVERFYGGAKLVNYSLNEDENINNTYEEELTVKKSLAKYAASLIEDGDTIFINSSSTAIQILEFIEDKHVTVITNNGNALLSIKNPCIELILTGGEVNKRKKCMVGDYAINILSKITADKCFLGVSGISSKSGLSTSILQETAINTLMLKRCNGPTIILADSTKVGKDHNFIIGELNRVSYIITTSEADITEINRFKEKNINVVQI
ncbi:DeoR/GlpR family DNA-binding transcription regulator [Clostridium tarantellae]|uniref:DeoR family transcriptional regulator n=1 Tax=Clostridium tarantellae TaxID=39493 RepID=A0A6I1MMJ6_9CLOT|nr:DeoR/GlpR family DNA-binding transcription regulator [Clostridium tarantellae]MPQ44716.1 DeoR family transcriptional regulator [Clostridium tarantellae]